MLSDSEESHKLTINEHFAKAYQTRKEREELQKLKDKYGSDFDEEEGSDESTDSESDESEDEDGEDLTPAVDAALLRTLARIKRRDPTIYEPGKAVYNEEEEKVTSFSQQKKKKDKSKPVTLRQVAFEAALEGGESRSPSPELRKPTHVEEQHDLRDETIAAFHGAITGADASEDDEGGGLLVPREKNKDELEREEEEYRAFLEKEVGSDLEDLITIEKFDEGVQVDKSSDIEVDGRKRKKREKKSEGKESEVKTKEQEDHEFLMGYILNRGWIDQSSRHIPTYTEITSSKESKSKSNSKAKSLAPEAEHDVEEENSDASFDSLNDRFEASYNFRFEEPGAATIQTFPRILPDTVRRQDSTRKTARTRKRERKEAEVEQKREEVRRMKSLKMKDMKKKLEKIGKEGGRRKAVDEDQALLGLDLDAEWDPDHHDKQMAELYGNDVDGVVDEEKPTWEDDIDIGDIHVSFDQHPDTDIVEGTKKKKKKKKKKHEDDMDEGGVNIDEMDADMVRDEEEWDGTEEMRKRKLKEHMAELDSLNFNDVVAGMPTRFRYVPIKPDAFALTPVEMLMATDKELNQYMSIKRYAPYQKGVKWDNMRNERLHELKQQISERMGGAGMDDVSGGGGHYSGVNGQGEKTAKKRKGRKERMKAKAAAAAALADGAEGSGNMVAQGEAKQDWMRDDAEGESKRKRLKKAGDPVQ
ncbi:hypothetical protein APHAL10511_005132 [Amanita phalloides]|nr:hypothetical protein APHAL10511_005132 [Amanita phalloides]